MSRFEMYKPSTKQPRILRSHSPFTLCTKVSSKSFLQIPKNSLVYYKRQKKTLNLPKHFSSAISLKDSSPQKLNLSSMRNDLSSPSPTLSRYLFAPMRLEEGFAKANAKKFLKRLMKEKDLNSKSASKLMVKYSEQTELKFFEGPLPKLNIKVRNLRLSRGVSKMNMLIRRQKKEKKEGMGNEGLCGWETDSLN